MANTKNYYYIDGNTVRELEPEHHPIDRQRQRRRVDVQTSRNRQREKAFSAGNVLFLSMALAVVAMVCAVFLYTNANVTELKQNIVSLQEELIDLQEDNDAYEKEIETSVSLTDIKKKAMNELGMKYPSKDQVVYYDITKQDYMQQYANIP